MEHRVDNTFEEQHDFFATIFEYLIKDYNTSGGGKYAEYYTHHAIANVMAKILASDDENLHNVEIYDIKTPRLIQFNDSSAVFVA